MFRNSLPPIRYVRVPADPSVAPSEEVLRLESAKLSCDSSVFVPILTAEIPGFQSTAAAGGLSILPFPTFNESIKPNIPLFLFRRSESRDRPENTRARVLLDAFSHKLSKRHSTFFGDVIVFWRKSVDEIKHQMKLADFTLPEWRRLTHGHGASPPQALSQPTPDRKDSGTGIVPCSSASTSSESSSGNRTGGSVVGGKHRWQRATGQASDAGPPRKADDNKHQHPQQKPGSGKPTSGPKAPEQGGLHSAAGESEIQSSTATRNPDRAAHDAKGIGTQGNSDVLQQAGWQLASQPLNSCGGVSQSSSSSSPPKPPSAASLRASLAVISNFVAFISREAPAVSASVEDVRLAGQEADACAALTRSNKALQDEVAALRRDLESTEASLQRMTDEVAIRQSEILNLRKSNEESSTATRTLEQHLSEERVRSNELQLQISLLRSAASVGHQTRSASTSASSPLQSPSSLTVQHRLPTPIATAATTTSINHNEQFPSLQDAAAIGGGAARTQQQEKSKTGPQRPPTRFLVLQAYSPDASADTQFASLKLGEVVKVERQDESGWWWVSSEGETAGVKGWFPSSFLRSVDDRCET